MLMNFIFQSGVCEKTWKLCAGHHHHYHHQKQQQQQQQYRDRTLVRYCCSADGVHPVERKCMYILVY